MSDVQTLVKEARELILAGDLEAGEKKTAQAKALKALDDEIKTKRLDFGEPIKEGTPSESATDIATKSWYMRQFGDTGTAMDQVMTELYGQDHRKFAWAKSADFVRYVRTGQADAQLHRALVYSPTQVEGFLQLGMSVAELKATQVESQDTLGGYLVPEDFRDRVVQRLPGLVAMRSISETMTTTSDRVTMPVSTGGDDQYTGAVRWTKTDESPTGTEAATNATYGQVTIPVHTIMGHVAVSKNLLEDTQGALSIIPQLQRQFAESLAIFEDFQFLVGNGVGGPQGVLKDATTGGPYTYTYGAVQTKNSGGATALTADAFRDMPYLIGSQYRNMGGTWIMSRGTIRVIKTLKAGDGTYLWSGRSDTPQLQQGQPPAIEGYPLRESETLASPTTVNTTAYTASVYPVIFITKGAYLIIDKVGMDITRYDDSTTAKSNQIVLVARRRLGGQLLNPWGAAVMKVSA